MYNELGYDVEVAAYDEHKEAVLDSLHMFYKLGESATEEKTDNREE